MTFDEFTQECFAATVVVDVQGINEISNRYFICPSPFLLIFSFEAEVVIGRERKLATNLHHCRYFNAGA
jgi:hypothetical protein